MPRWKCIEPSDLVCSSHFTKGALLAGESVIVELKSVQRMLPTFESPLISYLKLADLRLGLLINFNAPLIKSGIKRIVL